MLCRCEVSPSGSSSWPRCRQVFANIRTRRGVPHQECRDVADGDGPLGRRTALVGSRQQVGDATQAGPAPGEQVRSSQASTSSEV